MALIPRCQPRLSATEISRLFSPDTVLTNPNPLSPYQFDSNNMINPAAFDPTALYLLNHIPLPNDPQMGPNYLTYNGAPSIQDTDEYLVKIDYNIGKHHLSGHYFQLKYTGPNHHSADQTTSLRAMRKIHKSRR